MSSSNDLPRRRLLRPKRQRNPPPRRPPLPKQRNLLPPNLQLLPPRPRRLPRRRLLLRNPLPKNRRRPLPSPRPPVLKLQRSQRPRCGLHYLNANCYRRKLRPPRNPLPRRPARRKPLPRHNSQHSDCDGQKGRDQCVEIYGMLNGGAAMLYNKLGFISFFDYWFMCMRDQVLRIQGTSGQTRVGSFLSRYFLLTGCCLGDAVSFQVFLLYRKSLSFYTVSFTDLYVFGFALLAINIIPLPYASLSHIFDFWAEIHQVGDP